jgi:hypothetical protein
MNDWVKPWEAAEKKTLDRESNLKYDKYELWVPKLSHPFGLDSRMINLNGISEVIPNFIVNKNYGQNRKKTD